MLTVGIDNACRAAHQASLADEKASSFAHEAEIRPRRGNTRVQSPDVPVTRPAARHQHGRLSTLLISRCPRRACGPLRRPTTMVA
jgi:hypothetical protein